MSISTPLDQIMIRLELSNHDLVRVSTEQLTHKMVRKGRKGKRLTMNIQNKILNALRVACPDSTFQMKDLFEQKTLDIEKQNDEEEFPA